MAYMGFGAWALVVQQVLNVTVDTIVLWVTVKWRPKKMFSLQRLKKLYSFGWKLLLSSLLEKIYTEIRQLIIGKMYSSADLAYYNRGRQFPNLIVANINTSIDSVLFLTMANEQNNKERVKAMTRRAIKTSVYIMAPMMMGLAFVAEPVVRLILTNKWMDCIPFLRIFCVIFMFQPIHTANLNAIKSMGRSDLFLKLEIIKKIVGIAALISTMWFGVMAMAYSLLVTNVLGRIINSWPNRKLLDYYYVDQMKDIIPSILLAVIMGTCIYPFSKMSLPQIVVLVFQVVLGATIYIIGSILLKLDSFQYLWGIVRPVLQHGKK